MTSGWLAEDRAADDGEAAVSDSGAALVVRVDFCTVSASFLPQPAQDIPQESILGHRKSSKVTFCHPCVKSKRQRIEIWLNSVKFW